MLQVRLTLVVVHHGEAFISSEEAKYVRRLEMVCANLVRVIHVQTFI